MIIAVFLISFLFMEFVAWSNHKFIMHGFLWRLHKDHHISTETKKSTFEKNDLFFLIYAIPAIILIITGLTLQLPLLISAGAGITAYGFTYFMLHDVMIHQRLPLLRDPRSSYLRSLIRAHQGHHRPSGPRDFKNFGLLVFPGRFLKE